MGNRHKKRAPIKKKSLQDEIFELKMTSKKFENDSKRANKEAQKFIQNAKRSVKKGNDEDSRLYLASAAQKQQEADNYHRMSTKLQFIAGTIKTQNSSELVHNITAGIIPTIDGKIKNSNPLMKANTLQKLDDITMEIQVSNDLLLGQNFSNINSANIETNLMMLKREHYYDIANKANLDNEMNYVMENNKSNSKSLGATQMI